MRIILPAYLLSPASKQMISEHDAGRILRKDVRLRAALLPCLGRNQRDCIGLLCVYVSVRAAATAGVKASFEAPV